MSLTDAQRQSIAIAVALGTTGLDSSAAGELMTLQRAAWVAEARDNDRFDIPALTESLDDVVTTLSSPEIVVWGYRGAAGRLLGTVRTSPTGEPGVTDLGRLGVTPDLLGTGVGSALLTLGEARQPAGITRMNLITGELSAGNHRFYAGHGWSPDPSRPRPPHTVAFTRKRTLGPDRGIGPGVITADGCAVEVYAGLPARGEPEIITAQLRPGASLLELGCGTGRIADPLAAAGFDVLGVDDSPDMLAHVSAPTARGPIVGFDAGRRFDAVAAASHLINTTDTSLRAGLLETVRRHLAPEGVAIFQWHPPAWHDASAVGRLDEGSLGDLSSSLLVTDTGPGYTAAVAGYTRGEQRWIHEFRAARIGEDDLVALLADHGLSFGAWLAPDHGWFSARPSARREQPHG